MASHIRPITVTAFPQKSSNASTVPADQIADDLSIAPRRRALVHTRSVTAEVCVWFQLLVAEPRNARKPTSIRNAFQGSRQPIMTTGPRDPCAPSAYGWKAGPKSTSSKQSLESSTKGNEAI